MYAAFVPAVGSSAALKFKILCYLFMAAATTVHPPALRRCIIFQLL